MLKKALTLILPLLILAIATIYFFVDQQSKSIDTWDAIPANAALIVEIDKPDELVKKLENGNHVWESFLLSKLVKKLQSELSFLDSIQKANSVSFFLSEPLILSLHTADDKTDALFMVDMSTNLTLSNFTKIFNGRFEVNQTGSASAIYLATNVKSAYQFFFYLKNNLFVASANQTLLENSLASLSSKNQTLLKNPVLTQLRSIAGVNVDAKLYVNYSHFSNLLAGFSQPDLKDRLQWLGTFADWTEVDVILKKDEVLMTGFTLPGKSEAYFLNKFTDQQPVELHMFNVLPFNTNQLLWFGFSDFTSLLKQEKLETYSKKVNFDLNELLLFFSGEIAVGSNSVSRKKSYRQNWFLAKVSNKSRVESILRQLSKNTNGEYSSNNSGFPIGQINAERLIPGLFGDAFSAVNQNWYTLVGEYLVVGNSKAGIENFIRFYETGKTLDLNENFKLFSDNISKSSNILLFIKPRDFSEKSSAFVNKETFKVIQENEKTLKNLEGMVFQYSTQNGIYFTNFYLKNNTNYKEENLALWKAQLDDHISGQPFLVKDHTTGNFNVVVFDQSANIYLVSTDGRILWKKRVDALPESPIYEIDYYKNGKIQYLFNSPDFIYLIDKNGEFVEGYPKKLNPSATNGLSLMDYKNNKDYRLVLAQADKRIYNYKINGKQVNGWSKPRTESLVLDKVQRLVANRKDYFLITDSENNISIVNRRGNRRISLKENPDKAKNSIFYVNQTNSKGIILSTDKNGKLFYISASGKLEYTVFRDFSESHFFLYEDFNGDGAPDFIYLDGDKLQVFDRFKNILFSYQFDSPISIKPEFFQLSKKKKVLGVVADQEKTIYLFDNKGNTLISKGLVGETPFTVGSLENNNDLNLVTGTGNTLYNYRID